MKVRYEVSVNGKRLCIAGLDSYGVLTVGLSRVERSPEMAKQYKIKRTLEELVAPEQNLCVHALDSGNLEEERHLIWANVENLGPGDESQIKILPSGEFDTPIQRLPNPCARKRV